MRASVTLTALFFPLVFISAQINVGGVPYALRSGLGTAGVPLVAPAAFNADAVAAEDLARDAAGDLPFYSRRLALNATFGMGRWDLLPNGDRIWRLRIASAGALANELFFSEFRLPDNAILHVYDPTGGEVLGGFTAANNTDDGLFTTALITGSECVVEYYEPLTVTGQGNFRIESVGHAYRMAGAAADACEVDVKCSECNPWWQQRDGVVRLSVTGTAGSAWCSGSVVNNVEQDCKPYILTALHCSLGPPGSGTTFENFSQWKAYFRYQRGGCGTGTASAGKVMTGCVKRAESNDNGGDTGSDFLLIEMNNDIPDNFAPYFNGWSAINTPSTSGVGIHHPAGSEKKISTYSSSTLNSTWGGVGGTHWRLSWVATANGWGVTEGGSSGSPLFNNAGLVIGTLTGGASCCEPNDCGTGTGPTAPDFYGKMSYHWDDNPGPASEYLKSWLDPNGTGATTLQGSYNPCGTYTVYVGIDEAAPPAQLTVAPNPAQDRITVSLDPTAAADRCLVIDPLGRVLLDQAIVAQTTLDLNTTAWANGTYALRLLNNGSPVGTAQVVIAR